MKIEVTLPPVQIHEGTIERIIQLAVERMITQELFNDKALKQAVARHVREAIDKVTPELIEAMPDFRDRVVTQVLRSLEGQAYAVAKKINQAAP